MKRARPINPTYRSANPPPCSLDHEAMRRELRDKGLGPTDCPECGWCLAPAKVEPRRGEAALLSTRIEDFILWLEVETDFGQWDQKVREQVHKKLIEVMT